MSNVSSVTNYFPTVNEGFTTTLGSTITSGASTVPLTGVSGLTNGTVFVGIIEPGLSAQQVFTGIVNTATNSITNVIWTRGTNVSHNGGVTIVDYTTGTGFNMISTGILKQHNQDGTHGAVTATSLTASNGLTVSGGAVSLPAGSVAGAALTANSVTPAQMLGVDLFAHGGSLISNAPAAGTGQFYIQTGNDVVTTNASGDATLTFPTPFPNGLICALACNGFIPPSNNQISVWDTGNTASGFNIHTMVISNTYRINWVAFGW